MSQAMSFSSVGAQPLQGESDLCHLCFSCPGLSRGKRAPMLEQVPGRVLPSGWCPQAWPLCGVALFVGSPENKK